MFGSKRSKSNDFTEHLLAADNQDAIALDIYEGKATNNQLVERLRECALLVEDDKRSDRRCKRTTTFLLFLAALGSFTCSTLAAYFFINDYHTTSYNDKLLTGTSIAPAGALGVAAAYNGYKFWQEGRHDVIHLSLTTFVKILELIEEFKDREFHKLIKQPVSATALVNFMRDKADEIENYGDRKTVTYDQLVTCGLWDNRLRITKLIAEYAHPGIIEDFPDFNSRFRKNGS